MEHIDELVRPYDVAGWLGCSTETVVGWARENKIPGAVFLPNGRIAFKKSEVESFIREGGHLPTSPLSRRPAVARRRAFASRAREAGRKGLDSVSIITPRKAELPVEHAMSGERTA